MGIGKEQKQTDKGIEQERGASSPSSLTANPSRAVIKSIERIQDKSTAGPHPPGGSLRLVSMALFLYFSPFLRKTSNQNQSRREKGIDPLSALFGAGPFLASGIEWGEEGEEPLF